MLIPTNLKSRLFNGMKVKEKARESPGLSIQPTIKPNTLKRKNSFS